MLVLAVDDDKEDLELFCDAVKELDPGVNLMTASNGEEAVDYLLTKAVTLPDFVFLDVNMPRLDGRECLKRIRSEKLTKHLSVIIYSTSFLPADIELFKTLDAGVLRKATSYGQLRSSLHAIFAQIRAGENERVKWISA